MRSKLQNALLLSIVLALDAYIIFFLFNPWLRLVLSLPLFLPIVWLASHLGLVELLVDLPRRKVRDRRFPSLRRNVVLLLDEVRRLNWLVVDRDRGFRDQGTVETEIETTEQRLGEVLGEILKAAGRASPGPDEGAGTPPTLAPTEQVGEPPTVGGIS